MKLVFIRHTSVDVERGVCYGQTDVPVGKTFTDEAEKVKRALNRYRFDCVYSSPLSRCTKLSRYCGYPQPIVDARLMEMNFGEWEMQRYDKITDPRLQEWYDDFLNVRATGGESSMEQRRRLEAFLDIVHKADEGGKTVGIFTHGGIIIHALVLLGGKSYAEAFASQPGYGSITELYI